MADLKVRHLDDAVAARSARAKAKGVSLEEEEVRRTLTASVAAGREDPVRRAKALHAAAGGKPGNPELDSARVMRDERDLWLKIALSRAHGRSSHGRHQSA
jgi:plasmid stability protein